MINRPNLQRFFFQWIFFEAILFPPAFSAPIVPLSTKVLTERPKLILTLVVDQFRADYLTRFQSRFLPAQGKDGRLGGFNYLMNSGAYYPFAEYDILNCMTGPGHATILSGAYPYRMGIPSNSWYDQTRQREIYCVEDETKKLIGVEITPDHTGTSPKNFIGTTFGDELKNAGYPSRVISIAVKDRAAILMGGHRADLALWTHRKPLTWVTSQHYASELPEWVKKLNATEFKTTESEWKAEGKATGLSASDPAVPSNNRFVGLLGQSFPHVGKNEFQLSLPFGLKITENAAEKALAAYSLGKGKATDLLAVSFSSFDYAGHTFGLNSLEMEEMTVATDRTISKLLNAVNHAVPGGLKNVVVVLTADHGVAPNPDWLKQNKIRAERWSEKSLIKEWNAFLDQKFGSLPDGWIAFFEEMSLSLNQAAIRKKGVALSEVEGALRAKILELPGVLRVASQSDYFARTLPPGIYERQILKTFFPSRSSDLMVIAEPFHISGFDTAGHMTGYTYDRTVPLILSGKHIRRGVFSQKAEVVDIAPTLSFLTGVIAPSGSEGRVLSEALE